LEEVHNYNSEIRSTESSWRYLSNDEFNVIDINKLNLISEQEKIKVDLKNNGFLVLKCSSECMNNAKDSLSKVKTFFL